MIMEKLNHLWKSKKIKVILSLVTVLVVLISTIFHLGRHVAESGIDTGEKLTPVKVVEIEKSDLKKTFKSFTSLNPAREAVLRPQSQGFVREVFVRVGDVVSKDQKLFVMSSESQQLRAELDQIDYEMRNLDFKVAAALAQKNFISQKEHQQKELERKASQIRSRLSFLENGGVFLSPFKGVVAEAGLRAGDYIDNTNTSFVRVVDLSRLRLGFWIPQSLLTKVDLDSELMLKVGSETALAKITAISPTVDLKTGSIYVDADLESPPTSWRAGQYAEVSLATEVVKGGLSVPSESLVKEGLKSFVYVIDTTLDDRSPASQVGEVVKKVEVQVGFEESGRVQITGAIEELDQVVVEGWTGLKNGSRVEISSEY